MIIKCMLAWMLFCTWTCTCTALETSKFPTSPTACTALAKPTCSALIPPPITALQKTNIPSLTDHVEEAVKISNALAIEMYKELAKTHGDKNFFFSPMSIMAALAMTHLGTAESTAEDIKTALNATHINDDVFHTGFSVLNKILNSDEKSECILRTASRVFANNNFAVKEAFIAATKKYYEAEAQVLDFVEDSENSRTTINQWVEDNTNGKIKDLVQPEAISSMTAMILANAIYFKGKWLQEFYERYTHKNTWTTKKNEEIEVDYMPKSAKFKYASSNDFPGVKYAEMPYKGQELSFGIILPDGTEGHDGIDALERNITVGMYEAFISTARYTDVILQIPKFKIETTSSLKGILANLGMASLFGDTANFSNIADSNDLHLSDMVHQTFVVVNEEGTEAAAATSGDLILGGPLEEVFFLAHRPFIFFIKDCVTRSILFMGRVMVPEYK